MHRRHVRQVLRYAFIAAVSAAGPLIWTGVWPDWAGCPLLVLFFGGTWWVLSRETEREQRVDAALELTPEQEAARKADADRRSAEVAAERAEHERVEVVLRALLEREGIAFTYRGPMGGHMDKRDGTYRLAAPLPVSAQDVAALSGPLTRFGLTTTPDGAVALTSLEALDRDFGGIDVFVERPAPGA